MACAQVEAIVASPKLLDRDGHSSDASEVRMAWRVSPADISSTPLNEDKAQMRRDSSFQYGSRSSRLMIFP
jgi:hypothetical protein